MPEATIGRPRNPTLRRRRTDAVGARGQSGFALLEVVLGVALVSLMVAALAGALFTLIRVTDSTSERQRLQTELGNFAERLKAVPYTACAESADYESSAAYTAPSGATVSVVTIEYWERTPVGGGPGRWIATRCTDPVDDEGSQRLNVRGTQGDETLELQLVKAAR